MVFIQIFKLFLKTVLGVYVVLEASKLNLILDQVSYGHQ